MNSSKQSKWYVLGTVSLAVFMAMLDITIVNVALPDIQKSFTVSFTSLQWVLNAYTLVYAVMLLPVSKLGDRLGRKWVFLGGLALFIIGSLADGLATSDTWLNLARGFQGIGGAAMMSLSLSIVTASFPAKQRGLALGIWSSAVGLAVSGGPLIGGILVDTWGWRSIFWINVPIGLFAIIIGPHLHYRSCAARNGRTGLARFTFKCAHDLRNCPGIDSKRNASQLRVDQ